MSMFSSSDDDDDINFDNDFDDSFDFSDNLDGDDENDTDIIVKKKSKTNSKVTDDDDAEDDDAEDDDEYSLSDNVGQASVEIDVASLIAELESEKFKGIDSDGDLRKRLDEIMERKKHKHELDDFDEYDID